MSPSEVALVVVHRTKPSHREFLVVLRSPERAGYWHLIGGGVEAGETPAEAGLRELAEETGLTNPLSFEPISVALGYEGADGWVTAHAFAAEAPSDWEPVLDEEHVEHRWQTADEALAMLQHDEPREALRKAARMLRVRP